MSIKPFLTLLRRNQLPAFVRSNALFTPFYKLTYLAALKDCGLLEQLAVRPADLEALAKTYGTDAKGREALEAWLQLGMRLGLLESGSGGYALKGLARKLASPQNDAVLALVQEVAGLHHSLIANTPRKLRNGELWTLDDQDGELIARSSRALEAFQTEAIDRTFPASGPTRLLEVGCGSAFYIKYAADRNPSLSAVGLELQANVADVARRNIREWGLSHRVAIEVGDVRKKVPDGSFDIVTLYNNIYYFAVEERVGLLTHLGQFLRGGGVLLLTTCCQGGNASIEVLNLWGAATASGGRLPAVGEMREQMRQAGYEPVRVTRLIPGDAYYAFAAYRRS
jgi:SAM-dependent methyltransferase